MVSRQARGARCIALQILPGLPGRASGTLRHAPPARPPRPPEVCKDWARVVESSWQLAGVLPPSYPYEHPTRRLGGWRTAAAAQWEAMVRRRAPTLRRLVLTESLMDVAPRWGQN